MNFQIRQPSNAFFWEDRQLQEWASTETSSLILVQGSYQNLQQAEDIALKVTEYLEENEQPAVWVLSAIDQHERTRETQTLNIADVLKYLAIQILQKNSNLHSSHSHIIDDYFEKATSEGAWLDVITSVLKGLPYMYVVLDLGILCGQETENLSWPDSLEKVFANLEENGSSSILKVMLVSCWPSSGITPKFIIQIPPERGGALSDIDYLMSQQSYDEQVSRGFQFPHPKHRAAGQQGAQPSVCHPSIIGAVSAQESRR